MPCKKYKKTVEYLKQNPSSFLPEEWIQHTETCKKCQKDYQIILEQQHIENQLKQVFQQATKIGLAKKPKLQTKEERQKAIQKKIAELAKPKQTQDKIIPTKNKKNGFWIASIAAMLVAGILGIFYGVRKEEKNTSYTIAKNNLKEKLTPLQGKNPTDVVSPTPKEKSKSKKHKKKNSSGLFSDSLNSIAGVRKKTLTPSEDTLDATLVTEETAEGMVLQSDKIQNLWKQLKQHPKDKNIALKLYNLYKPNNQSKEIEKLEKFLKEHKAPIPWK
ncbi:MAG: hypothetical protein D6767_02985 [Candidatus Hydrogenedentota bacterium]|nr:MAG: hypothetical protein D6767_02985 [Candidatus Hydrogenedentota bacterium]